MSRRAITRGAGRLTANIALKAAMAIDGRRRWARLLAATAEPAITQARLLHTIVDGNAATRFGRDHRFGEVHGVDGYRQAVAPQDYESLRPYIEAQEVTGDGLTVEQPVLYSRTSGTTGKPKDIPITASGVERLAATQRLYSYGLDRITSAFAGSVLGIGGAAVEGHRPSGKPYGSATGLIYRKMPRVVRAKYVLPPDVAAIEDYETKYAVIAALSMAEPRLTAIATANPSTVARLIELMARRWDELVAAVGDGRPSGLGEMTAEQAAAADHVLAGGDVARARTVDRAWADRPGHLGTVWQCLDALVGWTGGSCGFALDGLRSNLSTHTKLVEYGYSASEFRGTIGVDGSRFGVPTIWDNHFEFVARHRWERGEAAFVGVEDLAEGEQYYVFVTTPDGLYRYDMNDVLEAGPRFGATPTLAFVRKGRGTTNITGEKLTEEQALAAMAAAVAEQGATVDFFVALANTEAARYRFLVEPSSGGATMRADHLATAIDRELAGANVEYAAKRASGRLHAVEVVLLSRGAGAAYRRNRIEGGQRDAQFKHLHLQPADELGFDFAASGLVR